MNDKENVWKLVYLQEVLPQREQKDGSKKDVLLVYDTIHDQHNCYEVLAEESHEYDPSHGLDLDDVSNLNGNNKIPVIYYYIDIFKK